MKHPKDTTNIKYLISRNKYTDFSSNIIGYFIYKKKIYYIYKVTRNFNNFLKEIKENFYRTSKGVFTFIENIMR